MLIFPETDICTELSYRSTWGHLPKLSAKFESWIKHLSVLDMKQQYSLKLIFIRGICITLFNTGIISRIPRFINDLLLYVAYLSSCFSNSKMVTLSEIL